MGWRVQRSSIGAEEGTSMMPRSPRSQPHSWTDWGCTVEGVRGTAGVREQYGPEHGLDGCGVTGAIGPVRNWCCDADDIVSCVPCVTA
jgi:hypothetical protein